MLIVLLSLDIVDPDTKFFVIRWVNCLLLREVPFMLSLRLWDTYLAEGPRMKEFLKYLLAAFLLYWSAQLSSMDFQVCMSLDTDHSTTNAGHLFSPACPVQL